MDLEHIEQLMKAMDTMSVKRLRIKQKDFEIELEKEGAHPPQHLIHPPLMHAAPPPPAEAPLPAHSPTHAKPAPKGKTINSPMVGTFYSSPSPEDPPFVKIGDQVDEQTLVCIIEAMKVMNEVKGGVKGKIIEILVKNGDPVEFGTPMFRVEEAG